MTTTYVDTSAAMKLLVDEPETSALREWWSEADSTLVASWLLHTELHCAAGRHPSAVRPDAIAALLGALTLIDVSRGDLLSAGTHTPLRSNDAIHLACALRIGADQLVTYDQELARSATAAGLRVLSPG